MICDWEWLIEMAKSQPLVLLGIRMRRKASRNNKNAMQ